MSEEVKHIQSTQALIDAMRYGRNGKALVKNHFRHPDHSKFFFDMVETGYTPAIAEQRFSWYGPLSIVLIANNFSRLSVGQKLI